METVRDLFSQDYDAFGTYKGAVPLQYQGALPAWLVPNPVEQSFNTTIFKSGTAFQAEIDMQNGVFYASKMSFTDFTASGYRLGIEKETLIPKFLIGDATTYLLWDGSVLTVSGTIYSTSGNIGGWTIGATELTGTNVVLDSQGFITAGNPTGQRVVMNGPGLELDFYEPSGAFVGTLFGDAGGDMSLFALNSISLFTAGVLRTFISDTGIFSHTGVGLWEGPFVPFDDVTWNLGDSTLRWNVLYVDQIGTAIDKVTDIYATNYLSCPLPTVNDALRVIKSIPKPRKDVKGHHGKRLYFDIEGFPVSMKQKLKGGKTDIELVKTVGVLVQAVRQLTAKVEALEKRKK